MTLPSQRLPDIWRCPDCGRVELTRFGPGHYAPPKPYPPCLGTAERVPVVPASEFAELREELELVSVQRDQIAVMADRFEAELAALRAHNPWTEGEPPA